MLEVKIISIINQSDGYFLKPIVYCLLNGENLPL